MKMLRSHRFHLALLLICLGCRPTPPPEAPEPPAQPPLVEHRVDAEGHALALWEKSPASPRGAILLLHGRTWSGLPDFDLQVPGEDLSFMDGLVAGGYATYALDLRGYGSTARDTTGWLTPNRAREDVRIVLEWITANENMPGQPVLFGWSLGSMVAQMTVQAYPDLASSVILFGYPVGDPLQPISEAWNQPAFYVGEGPEEPDRLENTAEAAASDFITPGSISQRAIDAYVAAALQADPVKADWHHLDQFNALHPERVTTPTLLLQGEFDPLAPTEAQAALFSTLGTSDKQWVVLPGGDHAALLETPRARMLRAITAFLERPH